PALQTVLAREYGSGQYLPYLTFSWCDERVPCFSPAIARPEMMDYPIYLKKYFSKHSSLLCHPSVAVHMIGPIHVVTCSAEISGCQSSHILDRLPRRGLSF